MLDDARKDYQALKQEVQDLQDIKSKLDERLKQANKIIAEYEIRSMKMEQRLRELDPNFVIEPSKYE